MKTNHRLARFCVLRKEKGKEGREPLRREGRRRARRRPWKMPPIERSRRKRSGELFGEQRKKREETGGEFREAAGGFPTEQGQDAHVLQLRGDARGHVEAWSSVRGGLPRPPPPPARAPRAQLLR